MSNQTPHNDPSTTIGVGGVTSGQQGATRNHETQQETGGSGGDGLTRNQSGETANAPAGLPVGAPSNPPSRDQPDEQRGGQPPTPGRANDQQGQAEAPGSAMTSAARGPQDTRPDQATPTGTGLGTPETGANQSPADLPPAK